MDYLLSEWLFFLIGAAILGAIVGWFIRNCSCKNDISELRTNLEGKINAQAVELEEAKKQVVSYKSQYDDIQAKYDRQSGDLKLMTSRWQTTLTKAKQLPIHQAWLKKVQQMYQTTRSERNEFENLACHYSDLHSDANQKIKRLNKRVTDQEAYQFRLRDMIGKVARLNDKVTDAESHTKSLHAMISQIQNKWRKDRIGHESHQSRLQDMIGKVARLNDKVTDAESYTNILHIMIAQVQRKWREDRANLDPELQNIISSTKAEMYALQNKSQTEIAKLQELRAKDLAEQNARNQEELLTLKNRVSELEPLEGKLPGQDSKFNRFMDKVRLVGTSKNTVLGRTYKQINEIKLEASEKERVFVDTCEEKDAVIDDLREQLRMADSRAQAASSAKVQEYKTKLTDLESELKTSKQNLSMLREHEQTIEAFKLKLKTISETKAAVRSESKPAVKQAKKKKTKVSNKTAAGLNSPAKGLNIAAAKVKDDLQVVKGIGPVMEGKLNDFGVYSYEQLARLGKNDIAALAETLGSFPDRINRDNWVSQSKKLHKKKYSEKIN